MRARTVRLRVLLGMGSAATVVVAAGCSLLTSLDGLTSGDAGDGAPAESGAETSLEGGPEASAEAATDALEAGPPDPCVGATFCDRFERDPTQTQGGWDFLFTDKGATFRLDTSTATSPSRSLAMFVPSGTEPRAQLFSPKFANVDHARIAFDMKIEMPARVMVVMRMQFRWPTDGGETSTVFDVFTLPDRIVLSELMFTPQGSVGYSDYTVASGFKPGAWQRWTLEVDARTTNTVGVATLDGQELLRRSLNNVTKKGTFQTTLGALYVEEGPVRNVSYDDFALTILP